MSQREAFGPGITAQDDEEAELARAISLSQEETRPPTSPGSTRAAIAAAGESLWWASSAVASGGGGLDEAWACSSCTLIHEEVLGLDACEACGAPKPEPPRFSSAVGDRAANADAADVADGDGSRGSGREADEQRAAEKGAAGAALSSGDGQRQARDDGEGGSEEGPPHTPETEPEPQPKRVPRKGPLRARYELRGILHHLGQHAFAGHYVTDVREGGGSAGGGVASGGREGGEKGQGRGWKRYDDSVVTPVTEARALEGAAQRTCYICFYALAAEK